MQPHGKQHSTHVYHTWSVHLQSTHRRPSRRSHTNDAREVFIPSEVVLPSLSARIVEGHQSSLARIWRFNLGILVSVTSWTGQGQIVQDGLSTTTDWYDVLYRKRLRCKVHRATAVLATASCSVGDELPFLGSHVCSRHTQEGVCLIPPSVL